MTNSEEAGNVLLLKKNSFFVSTETVDTLDVEIEVTSEHSLKEEECDVVVDDSDNRNGDEGDNLSQDLEHEDNNEVNDEQNNDADDDDEEDEWEDDDDLGYVLLKITEEEFFEMEEVSKKFTKLSLIRVTSNCPTGIFFSSSAFSPKRIRNGCAKWHLGVYSC